MRQLSSGRPRKDREDENYEERMMRLIAEYGEMR